MQEAKTARQDKQAMSCSYPSCYAGSHSCPYEEQCDKEIEESSRIKEEKRLLDLEEQRLRIAKMKRELGELAVAKIIERALLLGDKELTNLMIAAGWVKPFETVIDLSNVEMLRTKSSEKMDADGK